VPFLLRPRPRRHGSLVVVIVIVLPVHLCVGVCVVEWRDVSVNGKTTNHFESSRPSSRYRMQVPLKQRACVLLSSPPTLPAWVKDKLRRKTIIPVTHYASKIFKAFLHSQLIPGLDRAQTRGGYNSCTEEQHDISMRLWLNQGQRRSRKESNELK